MTPGHLRQEGSAEVSVMDACPGDFLGTLQKEFPHFSGTQSGGGNKGKKLNTGVASSEVPFLSPLPSEMPDGTVHHH